MTSPIVFSYRTEDICILCKRHTVQVESHHVFATHQDNGACWLEKVL